MYEIRKNCLGRLPIQDLSDGTVQRLMTERFQDLLQIVEDTIGMKGDAKHVKVPEAMMRTGFDRLIRLFYDGEGGAAKRLSMLVPFLCHALYFG